MLNQINLKVDLKEIKMQELIEFMTKINNEYPFAFQACVKQVIGKGDKNATNKLG
jgi:hypothetical protein